MIYDFYGFHNSFGQLLEVCDDGFVPPEVCFVSCIDMLMDTWRWRLSWVLTLGNRSLVVHCTTGTLYHWYSGPVPVGLTVTLLQWHCALFAYCNLQ